VSIAKPDIKEIFGAALECGGAERAAYLERACAGDSGLRARVESLLANAEIDDAFLRQATMELDGAPERESGGSGAAMVCGVGARIGAYTLMELIGEGGFGSVYLARQERPVRRRVALKLIKPGMDTRAVVARFEQERQALAVMDHPNIAKVLDAGATQDGRPYFVMELVRGDPITRYCDRNGLTIRERLALFGQVCQAVQHAHAKGVIHRDLKPGNVLVETQDDGAHARVIDFGVAKATGQRLTDKTVFTELRQLVGTLEYMSPEQAEGSLDIDTRTDVYSLGVLLYELLTGFTPLDADRLRSAALAEIQRIIREEDPARPSTRLMQAAEAQDEIAARRRAGGARELGAVLRGELDWIVMRALEKDRARRYETPSALGADLQRYLAGEVVSAAPPSAAYRLRKFARRNRVTVVAGAIVAGALLLGVIGTSIALVHARRQRDRAVASQLLANQRLVSAEAARAEAERARGQADEARTTAEKNSRIAGAVTQFFTQDVLDLTPTPAGTPEPTVRQLLDAIPAKIDQHFKSDPAVEGAIRERVGQLYRRLGEIERSRQYLEDAASLLEKGLGPDHTQTLSAVQRLGELNMDLERFETAAEMFDKAYQGRLRAHGAEYQYTMNSLSRRGSARVYAGEAETGLRDLNEALAHYRGKDGAESRSAVVVAMGLCDAYLHIGRVEEGRALASQILETILTRQGNLAGLEWGARLDLGRAWRMLGRLEEAMGELDRVAEITEGIYPPGHPEFIGIRRERGQALAALGRGAEAQRELETAYSVAESTFGASSPACREVGTALAELAERVGDAEAVERWRARLE
jgi:serine/threonine protein kinase